LRERLAIVGSGAIACGLAAAAAPHGEVQLLARSEQSADRARRAVEKHCSRPEVSLDPARIEIVTDPQALAQSTFIVEAVAEDIEIKSGVLADLAQRVSAQTILATTTSSLSIELLASASGQPERFVGLHVFNPVTKMRLVELAFPALSSAETRSRAVALCETIGKTAVEVPDIPGFVVNRLLFPYLFDAVRLLEETSLSAGDLDTCMRLGAGHPMGPLALLDLVGLDVSKAIGETIGQQIPPRIERLIDDGALGRKSGRGFHDY
jgi:3-hydroxybutyryl-CoA dehydrogenase